MLILTRRVGDSLVIANEITVTVLEVRSDQVRIGIDAPRDVAVHREEVYRQIARENEAAVLNAEQAEALRRRLRAAPGAGGTGARSPAAEGQARPRPGRLPRRPPRPT